MKTLKTILFCFTCALAFLLAAAISCALRAKYSSLPKLRTEYAYMYVANVEEYSFLQYNQASPEQGREALLEYLKLLQQIRDEQITFPQTFLHREFGLTYLRLYRLESAAGSLAIADDYMKSAQKEWSEVGWKADDVSSEALSKLIETRESREKKLYNSDRLQNPTAQAKQDKSKETQE